MAVPEFPNKRIFPRHRGGLDFDLLIAGKLRRAKVIDFSLGGLGILIKDAASLDSPRIRVTVKDIDIDTDGEARWARTVSGGVRAGIHILGPIKGQLGLHRLSDVLFGLQRQGKTGELEIATKAGIARICFKKGEPILPASTQGDYSAGDILMETGRITADQHKRSLEMAVKTGRRQGAVLVEMGYITASELAEGIYRQAERTIGDLFSLNQGRFTFNDGLSESGVVALKLNVESLVYHGVKAIGDTDRIVKGCPPLDSVLYSLTDPHRVAGALLSEDDKSILSLTDGKRTVKDIIALSPLSEMATLKAVHILYNMQMVEGTEDRDVNASGRQKNAGQDPEAELDPAFLERIERLYRDARSVDYYGILDVSISAPVSEIKKAYHRMAKEFHPDRYLHIESDTLKEKLHVIFSSVNEAYRELTSPKGGDRTSPAPSDEPSRDVFNKNLAATRFREGMRFYTASQYEQAATLFGQAIYLNDLDAEYHYVYAMALLKCGKMKTAEEELKKASRLDPFNSKYTAELGHIYLDLGFKTRAKNTFQKALQFNASDQRALEGMRKLAP